MKVLQELKCDAVMTFAELSVELTARLAETLGLPGLPVGAAQKARNKGLTRQVMRSNGLPTPKVCRIKDVNDLGKAAEEVGFPAVLKPEAGAASVGVKKVDSKKELEDAYREWQQESRHWVVANGNIVKEDSPTPEASQRQAGLHGYLMLEEYLDGDEVDVDLIMSKGDWQYAAVSDNGPTLEPYFNETWAVSPSLLKLEKQLELRDLAIRSVELLGFTDGIFHVELKYTAQGARLIEVNARMGGGPVFATNLRTWGVDMVLESVFCALGWASKPPVPLQPFECIANADVNALSSGVLLDLAFMEPLLDKPEIAHDCHVQIGDHVVGPKEGLPTWLVEVIVSGETPQEALDLYFQLEQKVQAKVHLSPHSYSLCGGETLYMLCTNFALRLRRFGAFAPVLSPR